MGRNAKDSPKSPNTIHLKLTVELLDQVDDAWRVGPDSVIPRNQFILKLVKMGVDEYRQTHQKYFGPREDDERIQAQ